MPTATATTPDGYIASLPDDRRAVVTAGASLMAESVPESVGSRMRTATARASLVP
jgi:hypothetical protein